MASEEEIRGRRVIGVAWMAAILAVFVLVRLPLLTSEGIVRGWNSDGAILGLMAKRIRDGDGFDIFFWGQNYLGPLTSLLAAAIRKTLLDPAGVGPEGGAVALRVAGLSEIAFFIVASFLALERLFGRGIALTAGLWLAVGPAFLVRLSAVPTGAEMGPPVASLLFLLTARAMTSGRPRRPRDSFAFGVVCGIGWWMNQTVVFVMAPALLVLILRSPAGQRLLLLMRSRPRPGTAAFLRAARDLTVGIGIPLAAGFATGYAPVWLGRLLGWYAPAYRFFVPFFPQPGFLSRLGQFVATDFWRLVGLEEVANAPLRSAATVLFALLLTRRVKRLRARESSPPAAALLLTAGIVVGGAYVFAVTPHEPGQLRYLAPVVPAALALTASAIAEAMHVTSRWMPHLASQMLAGALVLAGLVVAFAGTHRAVDTILGEPDPRTLLKSIEADGYTVCHADYWTAYKFQFLSDERVRFVPYHSFDRNRKESAQLRRSAGPQCLVTPDGAVRSWGPEDAADEGGPARRRKGAATPSKPASPDREPSSLSP